MHLFIFFGHDNGQGELVCRNKSKGDVDLKELPVRPGTKASTSMVAAWIPKLEAELQAHG
jgi:hypothetical protein